MRYRFIVLTAALVLLSTLPAHAQSQCANGFCTLTTDQQSGLLTQAYASQNLTQFVNVLFKMALSLGAILAVVRIAWAGYQYMTTDAWGSKSHAKEVLGDTVLGLLLLLSIWLILYQINPDILSLQFLQDIKPILTPLSSSSS